MTNIYVCTYVLYSYGDMSSKVFIATNSLVVVTHFIVYKASDDGGTTGTCSVLMF